MDGFQFPAGPLTKREPNVNMWEPVSPRGGGLAVLKRNLTQVFARGGEKVHLNNWGSEGPRGREKIRCRHAEISVKPRTQPQRWVRIETSALVWWYRSNCRVRSVLRSCFPSRAMNLPVISA